MRKGSLTSILIQILDQMCVAVHYWLKYTCLADFFFPNREDLKTLPGGLHCRLAWGALPWWEPIPCCSGGGHAVWPRRAGSHGQDLFLKSYFLFNPFLYIYIKIWENNLVSRNMKMLGQPLPGRCPSEVFYGAGAVPGYPRGAQGSKDGNGASLQNAL